MYDLFTYISHQELLNSYEELAVAEVGYIAIEKDFINLSLLN